MSEQYIDLGIGAAPVREQDSIELDLDLPSVSQVITGDLQPAPATEHAQLQACISEFGLSARTADEFITAGIDALNKSLVQACKAGVAFWAAQESLKNTTTPGGVGNFKEWIDKSGLTEQRVYECIRIAKYYARLPDNQRSKMLTIGKKQALLLAKMPQDVIDRVAENGTDILGEAETLTYDQLKDLLKQEQRKGQQKDAVIEHRDALIEKMKKRDNRNYEFLPQTQVVREECLVRQAEVELACDGLWALFEETAAEDVNSPEWRMRIEQVCITAQVMAARATAMLDKVIEHAPIDPPNTIMTKHILTNDEAEHWLLDYQMLQRKDAAAQALREQKREEAKPKGPGRPKKDQ